MEFRIATRHLWIAVPAILCCFAPSLGAEPVASFTIRADWFDRGNVRVSVGEGYADRYACIWNAGGQPNQAEYDLDFPVTADYTLWALYAAETSRPVDVYLDGKKVHRGLAGVTGSWQTSTARWETQCTAHVTAGRHTIKLLCPGPCIGHVCALRFDSSVGFPPDWRLAREIARRKTTESRPPRSPLDLIPEHAAVIDDPASLRIDVLRNVDLPGDGPADRNELRQGADYARANITPWIARCSSQTAGPSAKPFVMNLSPEQLEKRLWHAARLIEDYRTMDGAASDFLEDARREVEAISAEWELLTPEPDGKAKWEQFHRVYLVASRLEYRVAMANPLLDFDRLLLVRRGDGAPAMGLPQNWQSNCVLPRTGFHDDIAVLSPPRRDGALATLYRPGGSYFVGDVDLGFDADRMLFSSIGTHERWHVFEIRADGSGLRQLTPADLTDVDHYDACYLPNGDIIFSSTASMAAVPCVNGSTRVANFYRMGADGQNIRQLCFDQEHNWCPTVLPNGRVLYLRWEYTDTPHSHDRVLFHMNPDGTGQMEYYGSNSYWPNSNFYARPIPGRPTQFVGIVGGHHGVPRMGELAVFDVSKGRREADGAVQRIPGHGKKVEAIIDDNLVDQSWPKFLHPFPLNDKYFLVAAKPAPDALWGIYLVDVFDGMLLLREEPGFALLEPIPLRKTPRPPVIPDKVDLDRDDAVVYLSDIYAGEGLAGIPRGTVKKLRLVSYHYLYPGMGGPQGVVGMEGPWDIKRIVGTVPVDEDGSAVFRVPANTPLAVQPLDAEGKALQLMRSWFTAMPGEVLSCVGCHESQNTGPPNRRALAVGRRPSEIEPWRGPTRGFNFAREVQPVLDKYCLGCHNGQPRADGLMIADLGGARQIDDYSSLFHSGGVDAGHFSVSYAELHRFVRRPGMESDYHMLTPMEYHANTTQLVQMLAKGHHGVRLDDEAWDRLTTWIDLNAPYHGTWTEIAGAERVRPFAQRRRELLKLYAKMDVDPEAIPAAPAQAVEPAEPEPEPRGQAPKPECPGWPFDAAEAQRRQRAAGEPRRVIDLGEGVRLELIRIPAGRFVMGSDTGYSDERPATAVQIDKPFWIGQFEVTNAQFARFDPTHDSRVESKHAMQFGVRGFYVNGPRQPVVRVSWQRATAFCQWLSERSGQAFTLPTEAQWEYACRAGADSPFHFGDSDADFSRFANLADLTLREFVCDPYKKQREPFANPGKYDDWIPKDERFNDHGFVSEEVGRYEPNAWGVHDMHGNVWEWTRSAMRAYPYAADDGRNDPAGPADRVVRGGSWRDRPARAHAAFRLAYRDYQRVYNVGFRVVLENE